VDVAVENVSEPLRVQVASFNSGTGDLTALTSRAHLDALGTKRKAAIDRPPNHATRR
jgi:hypothetical protein